MSSQFLPYPQTGDVVLMNAKPTIIAAQKIVGRPNAKFSHAALAFDDEGYVDSLTKRGVGIARWIDLNPEMPIQVYRHNPSKGQHHDRLPSMLEHYGRVYNFALSAKNHGMLSSRFAEALYCSEYVAKVYTNEELGISSNSRLILPSDLQNLGYHPDWVDVTEIYRGLIDGSVRPSSGASGFSNLDLFRQSGETRRYVEKESMQINSIEDQLRQLNKLLLKR